MSFERAQIKELAKGVYLIDDAGDSTCYLVCGSEKAMVIDTANGFEDLQAVVRSLTDLPLVVVNTHGHCDHIYGNVYFDHAWMHPEDYAIAQEHFGFIQEKMDQHGLKPCALSPLAIGQIIDLGDLELEVVSLRGHTPGSIGLLDRKHRFFYTGDGLNFHLWMQLDHSLPIAELLETLRAVKKNHGQDFDYVLHGHAKEAREASVLDWLIKGCEDILAGRRKNDQPYTYFGGVCRQHAISDVPGECIVYEESKL